MDIRIPFLKWKLKGVRYVRIRVLVKGVLSANRKYITSNAFSFLTNETCKRVYNVALRGMNKSTVFLKPIKLVNGAMVREGTSRSKLTGYE